MTFNEEEYESMRAAYSADLKAVIKLLNEKWDPICVADEDFGVDDEYDEYAQVILAMLYKRKTIEEIANYISYVEYWMMNLNTGADNRFRVADLLLGLKLETRPSEADSNS